MTTLHNGAMTISRPVLLDTLKALVHTANSLSKVAQGDVYLVAYQEGFNAAIIAVALVIGAGDELKELEVVR